MRPTSRASATQIETLLARRWRGSSTSTRATAHFVEPGHDGGRSCSSRSRRRSTSRGGRGRRPPDGRQPGAQLPPVRAGRGATSVTFHYEAVRRRARDDRPPRGEHGACRVGGRVSSRTPTRPLSPRSPATADIVLCMSIEPGYSGPGPSCRTALGPRPGAESACLPEMPIQVDGRQSAHDNIRAVARGQARRSSFAGSSIFGRDDPDARAYRRLRARPGMSLERAPGACPIGAAGRSATGRSSARLFVAGDEGRGGGLVRGGRRPATRRRFALGAGGGARARGGDALRLARGRATTTGRTPALRRRGDRRGGSARGRGRRARDPKPEGRRRGFEKLARGRRPRVELVDSFEARQAERGVADVGRASSGRFVHLQGPRSRSTGGRCCRGERWITGRGPSRRAVHELRAEVDAGRGPAGRNGAPPTGPLLTARDVETAEGPAAPGSSSGRGRAGPRASISSCGAGRLERGAACARPAEGRPVAPARGAGPDAGPALVPRRRPRRQAARLRRSRRRRAQGPALTAPLAGSRGGCRVWAGPPGGARDVAP